MNIKRAKLHLLTSPLLLCVLTLLSLNIHAKVTLQDEFKITDLGLFFDGKKVKNKKAPDNGTERYDYFFGARIAPHGDSIKKYKHYVFMTWYQGGKSNRHVMLTRLNMKTGVQRTIELPHRHTGYLNQPWIGESHNTIAVGVSPIDGTIHLLYDMHAYGKTRPADGSLKDDYFRYSYTKPGAAEVADEEFTLAQFVQNPDGKKGKYKHLTLSGKVDYNQYSGLTYPKFFINTRNELLMYMRKGGNNNGSYRFAKYQAEKKSWSDFTEFNVMDAKTFGNDYNWGLYGTMKYVNGKLRVGFQQRARILDDKFLYQNGMYYAYSDNPDGSSDWKNHQGKPFDIPLIDSAKIKVSEPGDLIPETGKNQVHIVTGFDWNVTERGDVHLIGKVSNVKRTQAVNVHTYKPAGAKEFITSTDFAGADKIYTAGNDIYIIGLTRGGRPYIEKGIGGTNKFTRVYEAKSGKRFRHGNVYIKNGKLYYYLMERGTGTTQPIYLQVIDLDI